MKKYLRLIRIKHWLKNGLIFLPLFFSANLFKKELLYNSIIAFFVFSFVSSMVYIINDINDIEKDKKHPKKCKRPLASGEISVKKALSVFCILVFITLISILWLYNKNTINTK